MLILRALPLIHVLPSLSASPPSLGYVWLPTFPLTPHLPPPSALYGYSSQAPASETTGSTHEPGVTEPVGEERMTRADVHTAACRAKGPVAAAAASTASGPAAGAWDPKRVIEAACTQIRGTGLEPSRGSKPRNRHASGRVMPTSAQAGSACCSAWSHDHKSTWLHCSRTHLYHNSTRLHCSGTHRA